MKRSFLTKLQSWKNKKNRKPLIIRGVRQVGKTYLLKEFGKEFPTYHYVNFEKDPNLAKLFEKDLLADHSDIQALVNSLATHPSIAKVEEEKAS